MMTGGQPAERGQPAGEGRPAQDARLAGARAALARAEQRLRAIRRQALRGGYDAPAFARAVAACREAEAAVRRARSAIIPPAPPARPAPPPAGEAPAEESPAGREAEGGWARR
jgi:hypothetical protein